MKRNYSDEIRDYIYKSNELVHYICSGIETADERDIFFNSLDNIEFDQKIHLLVGEVINDYGGIETLKVVSALERIQLFTDYYISLKCQDKLYNTNSLSTLPNIRNYMDIVLLSDNDNAKCEMLDSTLEFAVMNDLDRTLLFKSLNKKDFERLKNINPFFEIEYNEYNKKIDLDYINDNISKIQEIVPQDKQVSYNLASRFIFDLYHINKEEAEELLIELFRQDLGIYSKNIVNDEEDIIKMGQINLNIECLQYMLKDYYMFSKKTLKYKKDDKIDR